MIDISKFKKIHFDDFTNYLFECDYGVFAIRTGIFIDNYSSTPVNPNLEINSYEKILVSLYLNQDHFKQTKNEYKYYEDKNIIIGCADISFLLSPSETEKVFNIFLGKTIDKSLHKCFKCNLFDEWNSLGKDGNWYCYKHCSY